ncbi:MAG: DUF3093 domain-containing protein [Acidobacteria bacterium]|nr:DUF3093 domain-containing protein [Acidobacteriota bacterium]
MPHDSASSLLPSAEPRFSEKLWPSPWIWLVVVGLSAAGILILAPISMLAGYIAAVVLFVIQAVLLLTSTPRIEVTDTSLQVGRAHIDRAFVGEVTAYRGEEATAERGTRLNGLAFLCLRGWISPVAKIVITDPADRTPYWLTSTRRPEQLAAALATPVDA